MSNDEQKASDQQVAQVLFSLIDALPVAEQRSAASGVLQALNDARSSRSAQPINTYLAALERAAEVHHNPIFHKRLHEAEGQVAEGVDIEHVGARDFLDQLASLRG